MPVEAPVRSRQIEDGAMQDAGSLRHFSACWDPRSCCTFERNPRPDLGARRKANRHGVRRTMCGWTRRRGA